MMMFFYLLCIIVIPSVIAYPDGAPSEACSDMKPHHDDHKSEPANEGFYLLGEVFNGTYIPGKKYQIQLVGKRTEFEGFFIQARAEKDQHSESSIVGKWTPLNSHAKTVECNKVKEDSITHTSKDHKKDIKFHWTAPSTDVGRIHFLYTIVMSYSKFIVELNATKERPVDAPFIGSYGQPEGCQQEECDFYVAWRKNGDFIDFRMEGNGNGWIALGITADNSPLNVVNRSFVDVLACQNNPTRSAVNVKDLYLPGNGSTNLLFDSSTKGVIYASGRLDSGRMFCSFTRVGFALAGQENEDANFDENNYIFFLSGATTGSANEAPADVPRGPLIMMERLDHTKSYYV